MSSQGKTDFDPDFDIDDGGLPHEKPTLPKNRTQLLIAPIGCLIALQTPLDACTRALYVAKDGTVLTGRSMDWGEDMHSNMWALPRGMKRDGMGGSNSIQWESKYGSLVVSAYDIGTSDGVNEKGLAANMHLAISDSTGDSAIFEYVNGKLVIHHGKEFKVLTNSPTYDQQLAIMEYWKMAGGLTKSLPGTSNAADRYVRASFLLGALPVEASGKYISGTP